MAFFISIPFLVSAFFRKKQTEKLEFGMNTNFGMGNSMVVFNCKYIYTLA